MSDNKISLLEQVVETIMELIYSILMLKNWQSAESVSHKWLYFLLAVCFFRFWVGGVETMTWNLVVLEEEKQLSSLWTLLVLLNHISECTLCISLMSLWETKKVCLFIL